MSTLPLTILVWLNAAFGFVCRPLFAPIAHVPGWVSNGVLAGIAGVIMLVIFKHTSNQTLIGRIRDHVKADLLTLKLFKDSFGVTLKAQGRLLRGAALLFVLALPPLVIMMPVVVPMLGQMGVWYQHAPLAAGDETIVILRLSESARDALPTVSLADDDAFTVLAGPTRIPASGEVWWSIRADQPGRHTMTFTVDGEPITKSLSIGNGLMPVSKMRPGMVFSDLVLYPAEKPFGPDDPVQLIDIQYGLREGSWASSADLWILYFFVVSIVFGLIFKGPLGVRF